MKNTTRKEKLENELNSILVCLSYDIGASEMDLVDKAIKLARLAGKNN